MNSKNDEDPIREFQNDVDPIREFQNDVDPIHEFQNDVDPIREFQTYYIHKFDTSPWIRTVIGTMLMFVSLNPGAGM